MPEIAGAEVESSTSNDVSTLALLGKKQVLKRRFGLWSLFGFAVCELITWETVLGLFSQAFDNGGPAGAIYGFMIAWFSTMSVYTVMSELASMAPIAGGQYYWVYILAPPRFKTFSSYIVGWLTTLAWVAGVAGETILAGDLIQGLIVLDVADYDGKRWQGTLLAWLIISVAIFINIIIPNWLPRLEVFTMVFHLVGFIAIIVTLLVMSPHFGSDTSVWLTSLNTGGWSSQGSSYCVGFIGNVATFVGADASVHMAEEVSNAALNIPRAILGSMLINGATGFAMMVALLYCLGDTSKVLASKTGFPFLQIFADNLGNIPGATVMGAIVLALTWACSIGITTTASRMIWSFARDRGLPFSRFIGRVHSKTRIPSVAVLVVAGLVCLLTLIYIGSSTAFNDVISVAVTGFYGSYFFPAALLLYHRVKGHISPHGTTPDISLNSIHSDVKATEITAQHGVVPEIAQAHLAWGPWSVPGILGILNNAYACLYMLFVIFWSFWPVSTPVSPSTMNYSVVMTGGVIILSIIWYWFRGSKEYKGPLIDEEVAEFMRTGLFRQK